MTQCNSSFDQKYLEQVNQVVTISNTCLDILKKVFPTIPSMVLPNIVNSTSIKSYAQGMPDEYKGVESKKLLTIGRLSHQKGYDYLLEIASCLKKMRYDFIWFIIGEGELKEQLLAIAEGEYVGILDSDDALLDNALETLMSYWLMMTPEERKQFKSITGRVVNAETGELIGPLNSEKQIDCSSLEARFVRKMNYEKWALSRTEVMREFQSPNIEGLHFYPENITYDMIGRKYKERFVENPVRKYYLDSTDSIIRNKKGRCKENYYLWLHNINDVFDYLKYDPVVFMRSFVGLARDGVLSGRRLDSILNDINSLFKKLLFICFFPVGLFLAYKK